ncbi:MAG: 3-hydroxyacyl-CoA dehydrogenase [Candidatus Aminicenantes bacterium]|nr:3-hydroxyacyl-CoA dehydrogenase [Candidatus Aminicenantes bacterium]
MASNFLKCLVVGAGVIGRGWVYVFSRAGCPTRIYDEDPAQMQKAISWFNSTLEEDIKDGFITRAEAKDCRALISSHSRLEEAMEGVEYIQESGPENLEVKRSIFQRVDRSSDLGTIIASSTSSLDIDAIAQGVRGIRRCITAHPFNPPHIVPVVEVLPAKETDPDVTTATVEFLKRIGQKPIVMNHFVVGYLINRIQAAVVREALHLVTKGVASVEAVDTLMSDGLGLRWALFGSFGINHTNADGGIREYYSRYGKAYQSIMSDLDSTPPAFDPDMIEFIGKGVDEMLGKTPVADHCRWRDRLVRRIRDLKEQDPRP